MIVFAAVFLISGGLLVKRFLDDRKTESEFADLQSMIDTARVYSRLPRFFLHFAVSRRR